ncbi:MAG: DMT family transporter [bacterium]
MPVYILFALLSTLAIGVADFIYSRATRAGVSVGTLTCSQATIVVPVTAVWAHFDGGYQWTPPALLGAAASLFMFAGLMCFMRSVRVGEASVSTPIYRISFTITALAAILFLGEQLTARKAAGFLLAGGAIFLLSDFRLGRNGLSRIGRASILWALAAMTAVGLLNVVYKLGMRAGVTPAMFLHSQASFFIVVAHIYAYFQQGGPRYSRTGWAHASMTAASFLVGLPALLFALRTGEVSVVVPISQLSFVVSVLMAALWLGERLTGRRILGILLAAGTVAAFSGA